MPTVGDLRYRLAADTAAAREVEGIEAVPSIRS